MNLFHHYTEAKLYKYQKKSEYVLMYTEFKVQIFSFPSLKGFFQALLKLTARDSTGDTSSHQWFCGSGK